jgi:hypothetical protein
MATVEKKKGEEGLKEACQLLQRAASVFNLLLQDTDFAVLSFLVCNINFL